MFAGTKSSVKPKTSPVAKGRAEGGKERAKPDRSAGHGSEAKASVKGGASGGSRRQVVVAKQAGQKRRSRSRERSRSPKRLAASPTRKSGGLPMPLPVLCNL